MRSAPGGVGGISASDGAASDGASTLRQVLWLASDHTHRFVVTFIDIYLFFSKLPAMMGSVKWVDW